MNRRQFSYTMGMAVVGLLLPRAERDGPHEPVVPTPAGFHDLRWIDFPEPVTHVVPWHGRFFVFTYRAMYEVLGCYGKTVFEPMPGGRGRVWFEEMIPECVQAMCARI